MRRSYLLGIAAAHLVSTPILAQQPGERQEQVHVVGSGDTLWDLAQRYLSDPYRWPEIFSRNAALIGDPHWIYPQQRILIPGTQFTAAADATAVSVASSREGRTVFYATETAQARAANLVVGQTRLDEVPVVQAGAFYGAGVLVPDSAMASIGRIEEVLSPTVLPRDLGKQILPFDKVYVSLARPVAVGSRIHLMRPGREVKPYGRIFVSTGTAVVLAVGEGVATVEIERMYDRVSVGDIALPLPAFSVPTGVYPVPASGQEGVLLAFEPEQALAAREDLAYVSLGRENGVTEGDELVAYLPGSVAEWGVRPAVDVARLQVVRAGATTSAVRVVAQQQPALEEGLPVRLVARMP